MAANQTNMNTTTALVKRESDCQIVKHEPVAKDEQTYNVFVGDLPLNATDDDLYKTFRECGTITSAKVIRRNGHRTKLYGFVNFKTQKGMDASVDNFQGFEVKGSCIVVKRQHSSTEKSTKGKNEFDCFQSVFIGNLPRNITEKKLKVELLGIIGPCFNDVRMKNGYGFVLFNTIKGAHEAIKKLNGQMIINQPCKAQFVRTRDEQNYVQHGGDPEELLRHRRTLLVTNIPQRYVTVQDLRHFFSTIGDVTNTYIPPQGSEHVYGFVEFSNLKDAALAMVKRQYVIKGATIDVSLSKPRAEPQTARTQTNNFKDVMLPQLESFLQNQAHMIGPQQQHLLGQMQGMNGPMFEMLAKFFYAMGSNRPGAPGAPQIGAPPPGAIPGMPPRPGNQIPTQQPFAHLQHPPQPQPTMPPQGAGPILAAPGAYPATAIPAGWRHLQHPPTAPPPHMVAPDHFGVAPDASRSHRERSSRRGSSNSRARSSRRDRSPRRGSRDRKDRRERERSSRKAPPAPTAPPPVGAYPGAPAAMPAGWNIAVPAPQLGAYPPVGAFPPPGAFPPQTYTPQQTYPVPTYSFTQQAASWPPLPGHPPAAPVPVTPHPAVTPAQAAANNPQAPWQTYNPAIHSQAAHTPAAGAAQVQKSWF